MGTRIEFITFISELPNSPLISVPLVMPVSIPRTSPAPSPHTECTSASRTRARCWYRPCCRCRPSTRCTRRLHTSCRHSPPPPCPGTRPTASSALRSHLASPPDRRLPAILRWWRRGAERGQSIRPGVLQISQFCTLVISTNLSPGLCKGFQVRKSEDEVKVLKYFNRECWVSGSNIEMRLYSDICLCGRPDTQTLSTAEMRFSPTAGRSWLLMLVDILDIMIPASITNYTRHGTPLTWHKGFWEFSWCYSSVGVSSLQRPEKWRK